MNVRWARIVSWHAIDPDRTFTSRGGDEMAYTLCGRRVTTVGSNGRHANLLSDVMPPSEKSCETCLRAVARRADPK